MICSECQRQFSEVLQTPYPIAARFPRMSPSSQSLRPPAPAFPPRAFAQRSASWPAPVTGRAPSDERVVDPAAPNIRSAYPAPCESRPRKAARPRRRPDLDLPGDPAPKTIAAQLAEYEGEEFDSGVHA